MTGAGALPPPVLLARRDVAQAAQSLGEAFGDYALLVNAAPDPERRLRLAQAFGAVALYYAVRWGEAYATSPRFEGVAAWLPGEHFPMTAAKALRAVPLSFFFALGRNGGGHLRRASAHLDALHRRLAPAGHVFLFVLGVRPAHRGEGMASRLLRPVLARLDREGRPCYVDTVNGEAVPMYEHFGFRILEESTIPGTDLPAWALLRPPAG